MLKIDKEYIENELHVPVEETDEYKIAERVFLDAIDKLPVKEKLDVEAAAVTLETIYARISYKKGFHDGMRFILNSLAGKEVIEV